jgi:hypothetical protein
LYHAEQIAPRIAPACQGFDDSSRAIKTGMTAKQFTLTAANGEDMTAEIINFASAIGLERAAPDRCSILLVLDLFGGFKSGHVNPARVVHEIQALEGIGNPSRLKSPTQFKRPPFKGLWHKHYLPNGLGAMVINFKKGLKLCGLPLFKQRACEAEEAGETRYLSIEDVKPLANDAVHGNWKRLANAGALTGQWIVYAQHDGKNYYLCLGTHERSGHESLGQQIDAICCQEFPFLSTLLSKA